MPSVTVISPSSAQDADALNGVRRAATWASATLGWDVALDQALGDRHRWGGAGAPAARASSLLRALRASDAVMCSGGGDHGAELLDHLDRDALPRGTFIGTSDNSMLASALAGAGLRAFCGPDLKLSAEPAAEDPPVGFARSLDYGYTRRALAGLFGPAGWRELELPDAQSGLRVALRAGDAHGPLVAANLRCLLKLAGTRWWPRELLDGAILLIEKLNGGADRAVAELVALSQTGALRRAAALCLGWLEGFDHDPDATGLEALTCAALELTAAERLPVWRLGLVGHRCPHALLPLGAQAQLKGGRLYVDWPAS